MRRNADLELGPYYYYYYYYFHYYYYYYYYYYSYYPFLFHIIIYDISTITINMQIIIINTN